MRKICLLALLAWNAQAPQVLAQDDDAELGTVPPAPELPVDSMIDDSEPVVPAPPEPPKTTLKAKKAPEVEQDRASPPPPPPTPPPAPQAQTESSGFSLIEGRRRPDATYGFAVYRPQHIGKYNHYKYLYGKERYAPSFYGGYYLFNYFLDIGIVGRLGYYHAEGHPLASRPAELPLRRDLTDADKKDNNQKLGLTLIPTQVTAEVALSPFQTRWVVLRAWTGLEYLYVQETIEPNLPSSATSTNKASTYTNSGWNQGLVKGIMASFSLTGLDPRSDKSLRALGIDRYYLSIFREDITTTHDKFGNFDRKNYGIAFSFEGLR